MHNSRLNVTTMERLAAPEVKSGGVWFVVLVAWIASGCVQKSAEANPAPPAPTAAPAEVTIVVLPNNTTVQTVKDRLAAVTTTGELAWQLTIPEGDTAIAPAAVAMNSVAYVRGNKAIHAATPEGKWLWSRPLDGRSFARTRAADSPVAMSDSTVALVIGDDVLRFDHSGAVRWRVTLPDGHVIAQPAAGMDGSLVVSTTAGLYSINPEGNIAWKRVVGN
jgi:outer membrane protein assembly factor BamB